MTLIERQTAQAVQKRFVTIKTKQIAELNSQIKNLQTNNESDLETKLKQLISENEKLTEINKALKKDNTAQFNPEQIAKLINENKELLSVNKTLKEDNKNLKNIVDKIKFNLAVEIKEAVQINNIVQIKKRLYKLLNSTLG